MGARRIRREQRQSDMYVSRITNAPRKVKERARRASRMQGLLRKGKLPYAPAVMSWLSQQLDKPSSRITQADVDKLLT